MLIEKPALEQKPLESLTSGNERAAQNVTANKGFAVTTPPVPPTMVPQTGPPNLAPNPPNPTLTTPRML